MARLQKSPPWDAYYHKLCLLFGDDPQINVIYDEENYEIKLYIDNAAKAYALKRLLPVEKNFGKITLKITIIPANSHLAAGDESLFEEAFKGNPILSYVAVIDGLFNLTYVVFINKVVQYFDDNIGDINGLCSTLYQNIAVEVFEDVKGVYFCTDIPR